MENWQQSWRQCRLGPSTTLLYRHACASFPDGFGGIANAGMALDPLAMSSATLSVVVYSSSRRKEEGERRKEKRKRGEEGRESEICPCTSRPRKICLPVCRHAPNMTYARATGPKYGICLVTCARLRPTLGACINMSEIRLRSMDIPKIFRLRRTRNPDMSVWQGANMEYGHDRATKI